MSDPRLYNFIQHTLDGNTVDARKEIDDIMLNKIQDIVNDRKVEVAQSLIGGLENDLTDVDDDSSTDTQDQEEVETVDQESQEEVNGQEAEGNTEDSPTDN